MQPQLLDAEVSMVTPGPSHEPRPGQSNLQQARNASMSKRKHVDEELISIARQRLLNPPAAEDQFDSFGKTIAHKLRSLPREQRIIAEKLFSEVLYEAELGNLTRQAGLSLSPNVPSLLPVPQTVRENEDDSNIYRSYSSYSQY